VAWHLLRTAPTEELSNLAQLANRGSGFLFHVSGISFHDNSEVLNKASLECYA